MRLNKGLIFGFFILGLNFFVADVFAQDGPNPVPVQQVAENKVVVKLLVVAATDSKEGIDPELASLAKHLNFLRYKGYFLLDTHNSVLAIDEEVDFQIAGGRKVQVSLLQKTPERARFRVQIFSQKGKLLDTTLSVNRNGTFIVAGPRHNDGILILPLQVQY